jgi:hypothetical protein
MDHCGGGERPDVFDAMKALIPWVARGEAPDQIVAGHSVRGTIDRTRPLCPYPQVAKYKGKREHRRSCEFYLFSALKSVLSFAVCTSALAGNQSRGAGSSELPIRN